MQTTPQQHDSHKLREELNRLRDKIRLEIELTKKEAKSEWEHLDREVNLIEQRLMATRNRVNEATKRRATELRTKMREFMERHRSDA